MTVRLPARTSRPCPVDGCTAKIALKFLMCRPHWRMVPVQQRIAVLEGGGFAAVREAIAAVNARLVVLRQEGD